MTVTGPNPREMASVLAQLRHLYTLLMREPSSQVQSLAEGILARQIRRLESLQRVVFETPPAVDAVARGSTSQADPTTREALIR